jgi:glycosyltransferase involved in cell wall biosynthesis
MSRLRIALVSRRYWPLVGGAEVAMANLAAEFRRLGHEPIVLTAQWEPHWPTDVVHREVPVVRLPQPQVRGWGTIRYMHALSRWLRRNKHQLDAVLVSMLKHDAYSAVATLHGTQVPVVLRAEGAGETGDCQWQRTARFGGRIQRTCQMADTLIAPSRAIEAELLAAGYSPARVQFVANGVEIPAQHDATARRAARSAVADANLALEMVADAPLVMFTGRLHQRKGLNDLVRTWQSVALRRPNARLWLIGEGPHREPLFDLIVDLGLHHQVFLPGAFDDATELLAAADVFVLPSYEEGMSLALLEAMAAGLPVVATDIPGNRLLVTHEEHGLLVPPGDSAALHAAIERLLDDAELAQRLAQNARTRVIAEFSLAKMASAHLDIINEAIAAKTL